MKVRWSAGQRKRESRFVARQAAVTAYLDELDRIAHPLTIAENNATLAHNNAPPEQDCAPYDDDDDYYDYDWNDEYDPREHIDMAYLIDEEP